jgi:hypothetical protein
MKAKCKTCGGLEILYLCEVCDTEIHGNPRAATSKYCSAKCGQKLRQQKYRSELREKARKYDAEHSQ